MSNLGAYQDMTVSAKQAGGVEAYIKAIERGVAPKYIGIGMVIGVTGLWATAYIDSRLQRRRLQAQAAKGRLYEQERGTW